MQRQKKEAFEDTGRAKVPLVISPELVEVLEAVAACCIWWANLLVLLGYL